MARLTRRIAIYVGSLVGVVAVYTAVYRWGMATLEGEPRTWYGAVEIVVQSMTTTGYGQDAPWETLPMTALMVLIQVTGIAYLFVAFPLFVVPWLRTLVEPSAPEEIADVEDHVVVVEYTELCAFLVDELESRGHPYVIVEEDQEQAQELYDDGVNVLHGDPSTDETLESAHVEDALAVVVDATEEEPISTILTIDERNPDVTVLALIDDQTRARYLRYAGVDEVLSPNHRIGKALGDKVRGAVTLDTGDEPDFGDQFNIGEYPIDRDSEFFDVPLEHCLRIEESGATVLGAWVRGDFVTRLTADLRTDENTSLVVAGDEARLDEIAGLVGSRSRLYRSTTDPVIVVGSDIIGSTVVGGLERAGLETLLVEREGESEIAGGADSATEETLRGADVVGDPTTEQTFHDADIEAARTVVITLEHDDDAILAALIAQELNPDAHILAAVRRSENVSRLRAAGVDYVLALPNVAGRMVIHTLFEGEVMTFDEQVRLVREDAASLVGDQLSPEAIREATGSVVVALERDGEIRTEVTGQVVERDDALLVVGTEDELERLREWLQGSAPK